MRLNRCWLLLLCFVCLHTRAQEAVALSHYVFNAFTKGKVQQKNGSIDEAMLNYNVLSKEMVFESSPGQFLALANPEKIDTIFIMDRKFVPVNNQFYELLTSKALPLLVEYTCTVREPGSEIGYGMTSVTTASPAVKSLIQSGGAYSLKLPDGFQVVLGTVYWLVKDGKYLKVNSAKQLLTALPAQKDRINELIKMNKTNFAKKADLVQLIQQL